jgi:hypothetical protein
MRSSGAVFRYFSINTGNRGYKARRFRYFALKNPSHNKPLEKPPFSIIKRFGARKLRKPHKKTSSHPHPNAEWKEDFCSPE